MRISVGFLMVFVGLVFGVAPAEAQAVRQAPTVQKYVASGYEYLTGPLGIIGKAQISDDDVFYNPATGHLVVGITNHPQVSGWEGTTFAPGDCYYIFHTGITGARLSLIDKWGTGFKTIRLYRAHDGLLVELPITISDMPGCDTTDAF